MAIKTEQQIERDFFTMVKSSALGKAIRGTVYRPEMRPANAKTEDIIVKFFAGLDSQVQSGVILLNIYVPDIAYKDGRKVEDMSRIGELEELCLSFVNDNTNTEYRMETDGSPSSMLNEEIEQHLIYCRIKFNRITF